MEHTGHRQAADILEETPPEGGYPPLGEFLRALAESRLLGEHELRPVLAEHPGLGEGGTPALVAGLTSRGLLNDYQVRRLLAGQTFGLVLGNYRILDRIGSGGMGVVYKAEHVHMKRAVAVKVLAPDDAEDHAVFLERFTGEMQALAVLSHPNIVLAFDAGEVPAPGPAKALRYLVMEYVPGADLEQYVLEHGPLPAALACDFIRQAAHGLCHAHEHGLIHRDVKPSNLLVTGLTRGPAGAPPGSGALPHGQVKILDFGLARLCRRRCTEAHSTPGTVDYMAPEQARDARSVDIRADIYGLGGTLYWLLTGRRPFPGDRPPQEELLARQYQTPTPVRALRPDIPIELEAIVCQMMALDPGDRYPTPLALIAALNDFLEPAGTFAGLGLSADGLTARPAPDGRGVTVMTAGGEAAGGQRPRRVLVVSPRAPVRDGCREVLEGAGLGFAAAARADEMRAALERFRADVVLVDAQTDAGPGLELCRRLRAEAPVAHLKSILLTADGVEWPPEDGACDDQLPRGAAGPLLLARVRAALRLKEAEERSDRLAGHLLATNGQLEKALRQRDSTTHQTQDVLIFAMAKMAELRGQETGGHLLRMQGYVRVLAEEAMRLPAFAPVLDDAFVGMLERCVLLHDVGKVAVPDHVLMKPGKLDPSERSVMESHTVLGAGMLEAVARQHGACLAFLQMAVEVVRSHHERYDGGGYPDGLAGEAIPLAARIVTVGDVYDAMRSKLVYKPGLSHAAVRRLMLDPTQGQFDPALLVAFRQCETNFEQIFDRTPD
jgi:response regulator RpfG family c-di-GMP phosphodiesterase